MPPEHNDGDHARALAVSLQAEPQPQCPQLRPCHAEGLYPVQGYCVLPESPGWFMALFPGAAALKTVAEEVERETMRMIDEAR